MRIYGGSVDGLQTCKRGDPQLGGSDATNPENARKAIDQLHQPPDLKFSEESKESNCLQDISDASG
jgi:hypothetical protein